MKIAIEFIERLPERSIVLVCLLLCFLVGSTDYITGDFSISLFYFVPIAMSSWFIGKRTCYYIAMICGMELYIINLLVAQEKTSLISLRSWNALMEVGYLFLTAFLISKVRAEMEQSKQQTFALEVANNELESFGYSVSHDLRSPLVWIGGYCHSVLKHQGDRLDEKHRTYLMESCKGLQRMEQLIEALLGLSQIAQGDMTREPVDLSEIAKDVAEKLMLAEPGRQVTFHIAEGIICNGDQHLLRVVLGNLLNNAWKYASEREHIVMEFGMTVKKGINTYFVRDNGAGFDMTIGKKLFVPFQRLHDSDRFKGHGIGLTTVKRVIDRHQGCIWAESKEGHGATFYFTLWYSNPST